MINYGFKIFLSASKGANRLRKLRTPNLNTDYVSSVLQEYGIVITDVSIKPIKRNREGFVNFYYSIAGKVGDQQVQYFASKADILVEPLLFGIYSPSLGFKYQLPRERKQKDFDDLTFLHQNGVPSVQPVAFDRKGRMTVELFEKGNALRTYLENPEYPEDGKLELSRKALLAIRGANSLGRYCPDTHTDNFFVTQDNGVILTDMEMASSLEDGTHDLATFVYSAADNLDVRKLLILVREMYPVGTIRKLPQFSRYMRLVAGSRFRTAEALSEV